MEIPILNPVDVTVKLEISRQFVQGESSRKVRILAWNEDSRKGATETGSGEERSTVILNQPRRVRPDPTAEDSDCGSGLKSDGETGDELPEELHPTAIARLTSAKSGEALFDVKSINYYPILSADNKPLEVFRAYYIDTLSVILVNDQLRCCSRVPVFSVNRDRQPPLPNQ